MGKGAFINGRWVANGRKGAGKGGGGRGRDETGRTVGWAGDEERQLTPQLLAIVVWRSVNGRISQAWNLPEDEVNPREFRRVKKKEAMMAGGFAIIPMMIWSCFCKMLPVISPRAYPAEYRIWARALYKNLDESVRFSSMKVVRIKGERPIVKCLGDVQDIHKGLAVLRIGKNCSCCLKEYEPED
eukprot:g20855.t1